MSFIFWFLKFEMMTVLLNPRSTGFDSVVKFQGIAIRDFCFILLTYKQHDSDHNFCAAILRLRHGYRNELLWTQELAVRWLPFHLMLPLD